MNLKNNILKTIQPTLTNKQSYALARVISYNHILNTANIFYEVNGQTYEINDIDVPSISGIKGAPLKYGDTVNILIPNSVLSPKIISVVDNVYHVKSREHQRHSRNGAYLCSIKELEGNPKPTSLRWIDYSDNPFKFCEYKDKDPVLDIQNKFINKSYFLENEVGIYNPTSSSIINIKEDGVIDIFTATNLGLRINPNSKTIESYGDAFSKCDNWKIVSNSIDVISKDINIECDRLNIKAKEIIKNE